MSMSQLAKSNNSSNSAHNGCHNLNSPLVSGLVISRKQFHFHSALWGMDMS